MTTTIRSTFTANGGQLAYIAVDGAPLFEVRAEAYGVEAFVFDGRWQPLRPMAGSFDDIVSALARIAGQSLPADKVA